MPDALQQLKAAYKITGNYEGLNMALQTALKVAPVDISVLIVGENGSGKEVFPRIIHDASARKRKPYMAINCGAIPEGTIDSELFGHVKGAFTTALSDREGYFATANGGTLFLDEVGELPLATQARLLRVLETGEFLRLGSSEVQRTDVRIVAATNVDLPEAIRRGQFRQDLYYRLNAVTVAVPPLRERGGDIALLFRRFALEMQERYKMPPVRLNEAATDMLSAYPWPGNVRQLLHVVENMSITCDERLITPEILRRYLPEEHHTGGLAVAGELENGLYRYEQERDLIFKMLLSLRNEVAELRQKLEASSAGRQALLPSLAEESNDVVELVGEELSTVDDAEKELIRRALEHHRGHRGAAAKEVGLSERTLYRKIKEYGLDGK